MTSAITRLSRVSAGAALALALSAPALAAPMYLKIPDIEGESARASSDKPHIAVLEVQSWSWGETQAKPETNWKVEEGEKAAAKQLKQGSLTIKQGAAAESGEKGGTEDINIGVGELQEVRANDRLRNAGPVNGAAPGEAEITLKGAPAASGLPTGKRQHKPISVTKPVDKGSVSLKLKSAWDGCRVGARYPSLQLSEGAKTHTLSDVVVASCGAASGDADDRPTEEVAFYYNKVG